ISVTVPTVDRGLRDVVFWSIEIAGDRPSIESTSGLSIWPRNWRAYALSDSTYRRWPSAEIVSNASDDLPDPDSPVMTTSASRGIFSEMSRRLCSRAPETTMQLFGGTDNQYTDPNRRSHGRHPAHCEDQRARRRATARNALRAGLLTG